MDCTGIVLVGAELVYYNGMLYLFSGYNQNEDGNFVFYEYFHSLCYLDLNDESMWVHETRSNNTGIFELSHGGSCLIDNFIFYFFGSFLSDLGIEYSDKIYTLNLDTFEWRENTFECPSDLDCAIDSFSIICYENNATINGGRSSVGSLNSVMQIDMYSLEVVGFYPNVDYPTPRAFATLTQSSTKLLLFGGINKGDLFNEVWEFEFLSIETVGKWRLLPISGSAPEPRYGHAAAVQGIFTFYVGGQTYEDVILSDIWLLNTMTNTWTEYIPSGTQIPPVTRTCLMIDLPKLYFIGGLDYSGSTFDLWEYDISTNKLVLLRKTQDYDTRIFGHACQLIKRDDEVLIYTFYGMTSAHNDLYCSINEINITDTNYITINRKNERYNFGCRGNFGYSFDGQEMIFVGGEVYPDFTMNDLWLIEFLDDYYDEFYIEDGENNTIVFYEKLSGSSVITFSDYIFVFSGYYNGSFSINSDISSSIYAIQYTGSTYCSPGYYEDFGCKPCPEETYSPLGIDYCIPCPLGTVNRLIAATHISQCIPCELGSFYNEDTYECLKCPDELLCPVGSREPLKSNIIMKDQQTQPMNYVPKSMDYIYYIIIGIFFIISILVFAMFYKSLFIRVLLNSISLYKEDQIKLDRSVNEEFTRNLKFIGGLISAIFICFYFLNIASLIIDYVFNNEIEIRNLIPLASLLDEQEYTNNHLTIQVYMYSYRGDCYTRSSYNSDIFNVNYDDIKEDSVGINSVLCTHSIKVDFDELFITEAFVELDFLSYTSDIALTISADSGNPGAKSSVTQVISSNDGNVLIGSEPNIYTFSLTPAFYSQKDYFGDPKESLGFYLSSEVLPEKGSTKSIGDIFLATGFKIKVRLVMSEFGITTYRYQQVNVINFILLLLSAAPGALLAFKLILRVLEIFIIRRFNLTTKAKVDIYKLYGLAVDHA